MTWHTAGRDRIDQALAVKASEGSTHWLSGRSIAMAGRSAPSAMVFATLPSWVARLVYITVCPALPLH
jgi:hypothetical protein